MDLPTLPDLARMRRDRWARLQEGMAATGIDALVLLNHSNVTYATGATWPVGDAGRAHVERPVAVAVAGTDRPHLFSGLEDLPPELGLDADHLHGPVYLDVDEGVTAFARTLAELVGSGATIAVDEVTGSMHRQRDPLLGQWPPRAAGDVVGKARRTKTPDELSAIRHASRITEQAMAEVQAELVPGARQSSLTARFLHRVFELGAQANSFDPIWQVMPDRRDEMPWTTHGDIPCPLLTTERILERGDVLWVDASILYEGLHSDFGRTWIVGAEPTERQQAQYRRWRDIDAAVIDATRAGATGADLTAAARAVCDGETPWMPHFYLAHGLGLDAAEMPYIGTDLGEQFDAGLVLEPGMIVVVEPIVWDEGHGGYRSENIYAVTDDGALPLCDYPYAPYED